MRRVISIILSVCLLQFQAVSYANEFACQRAPETFGKEPIWTTSGEKDLKFVVSWAFQDPENCIVGMYAPEEIWGDQNYFQWKNKGTSLKFPATWKVTREGEMTLVSAETEFPIPLLRSLPNVNFDGFGTDLIQGSQNFSVFTYVKVRQGLGYTQSPITASYGLAQLWGNWFSKNQAMFPDQCQPVFSTFFDEKKLNPKLSWKVLTPGSKPTLEITIQENSNCIFLVHTGPLAKTLELDKFPYIKTNSQAERPFWSGEAPPFFNQILSKPDQLVQIGLGDFTTPPGPVGANEGTSMDIVKTLPEKILSHSDSVTRVGSSVKIISTIDATQFAPDSSEVITIYTGFYVWYSTSSSYSSAGWRITYSGNSWSARYSSGFSSPGGMRMGYVTRAIKVPVADLFISADAKLEREAKSAAEFKAKQEAEAKLVAEKAALEARIAAEKAAADLKRKQLEDQRIAQHKQSCLQHNVDLENLIEAMNQLRNSYPTKFKLYFEELRPGYGIDAFRFSLFNSRVADCDQIGKSYFASDISSFSKTEELWTSVLEWDKGTLARFQRAVLPAKKTTITCVNGKLTKKVIAVKPKCPAGYKKK